MRRITMLVLIAITVACGGENRSGSTAEGMRADGMPDRSSSPSEPGHAALLCDRIEDDEAFTPAGAEPVEMPDLASLNSERRCLFVLGVDTPIEDVREFYRSALTDRGYETADYDEGDGIVQGNLSRTFVRGTKPGLHVHLTIDEFDPEETPLSEHKVLVKLQFDDVGG